MIKILIPVFILLAFSSLAQNDSVRAVEDILAFQKQLNDEFKDRQESPLEPRDFRKFKGLPFFPIDVRYRTKARLTVTANTSFFQMRTTTSRLPQYRIYGTAEFTIGEKTFNLPVYQSQDLMKKKEYENYLFFPFTDLTNGKQTYPGGRYIELRIPKEGEELIIDFNKAFNPYCAYNHNYSCPIVPAENQINIEIPAGVKYDAKKK